MRSRKIELQSHCPKGAEIKEFHHSSGKVRSQLLHGIPTLAIFSLILVFGTLATRLTIARTKIPAIIVSQNSGSIGRYDIYELTLNGASASYGNPWDDVRISAIFDGPSGHYAVGGFYYDVNTWKVRFAPSVAGKWTWRLVFSAPDGTYASSGSFTATESANSGFLRVNPAYPRHFLTEGNGNVFYAIGFNDCVGFDFDHDPWLWWGMDGTGIIDWGAGQRMTRDNTKGGRTDQYFDIYASQGKNNYFRAGPGNCAIGLLRASNVKRSGRNTYDIANGKYWDTLVAKLHADSIKYQMEMIADPRAIAPNFDLSNAPVRASVLDYHQYILNRFGAYVDVWELFNEQTDVPQGYLDAVTGFLNAQDPYRHPITMSFDQPKDNASALAVSAGDHSYYGDDLTTLDQAVARYCNGLKNQQNLNKPLIAGEIGNSSPMGNNVPGHYRDMLWTNNMNQCASIFWNMSGAQVINAKRGPTNMYIGPQQRLESAVFSKFIAGFDPAAQPLQVALAPVSQFRAYVLASAQDIVGYFVHSADPNVSLSGASVQLSIPANGMSGQWIDPATGNVLKTFSVPSGLQTLPIPSFMFDIALRIRDKD